MTELGPAQVLSLGGNFGLPKDIVSTLDVLIEVTNPDGQPPLDVFVGASVVFGQ